jgi:hypothetical protein
MVSLKYFIPEVKLANILAQLTDELNGWAMHQRSGFVHSVRSYASDASAYGYGAAEVICGNMLEHLPHPGPCTTGPIVSRPFSIQECEESSTLRELTAVKELVVSQAFNWSCEKISIWCDNMAVSAIIKKGSKKLHLHKMAIEVHSICHQMEISLSSIWMSRDDPRISQADSMSRFFDDADWGVDEDSFAAIAKCMPEVEVDIFANDSNRKCEKFFSRTPSPLSSGVNAFSQRLERHGYAYVCPPIDLIPATIKHILLCRSVGTLAIPKWPASPFWTNICPDGVQFSSLFTRALVGRPKMRSGVHVTSEMFSGWPKFDFMYLEFDGKVCLPLVPIFKHNMCSLNGCGSCSQ